MNKPNLTAVFQPTIDWLDLEILDTQRILNRLETARSVLLEATIGEPVDPPLTTEEVEMYNKAMDYRVEATIGHNSGNGTQKPTLADTTPHAYEALAKSILDDKQALRGEIFALLGEVKAPMRAGDFISVFKARSKKNRQRIYNALSQMKKAGDLAHENGTYRLF